MNTREFLKTMLVAAIAPTAFIPVTPDRLKWKWTRTDGGVWVLNPKWVNAPFEILMAIDKTLMIEPFPLLHIRELEGEKKDWRPSNALREPFPLRYAHDPRIRGVLNTYDPVPPFIKI